MDERTDWQRQRDSGLEAFSRIHAEAARSRFRVVKARQLELVGLGKRPRRKALDTMRTAYSKLSTEYLRITGTIYSVWETHGPKAEWDEVLEARDDAVWDRLVERGLAPWEGHR